MKKRYLFMIGLMMTWLAGVVSLLTNFEIISFGNIENNVVASFCVVCFAVIGLIIMIVGS